MERDFKGVWIPKEIWLDDRLSALEKMIYAEIDSLDINNEGCFAKNEYLAQFCKCSESAITKAVSHMKKLGYITVDSFDGRGRKIRITSQDLRDSLVKFTRQSSKNYEAESENLRASPNDTLYENTIRDNYKSNKKFVAPTIEEVKAYCAERNNNIDPEAFIDHYQSNGWRIGGKSPMRDWKAAVRQWERNDFSSGRTRKKQEMVNKSYSLDEVEAFWGD